jgi:putative membrane protein insertion efficiency factor
MSRIFIFFIRSYQILISPYIPPHCRFYPTCSEYGLQSIKKYGIMKGLYLLIIRLGKCHPFHEGGFDPVK